MKKLIISSNTYSWIPYCAGMLMSEESDNSLYIINKDYRKMCNCKYLCKESIFIQRQHDIYEIAQLTNISNINFYTSICDESLKMQVQLSISFKGINEVYYPEWDLLDNILIGLSKNLDLKCFRYKPITNNLEIKKYSLDKDIYEKKLSLSNKMVGINSKKEIKNLYKPIERFY